MGGPRRVLAVCMSCGARSPLPDVSRDQWASASEKGRLRRPDGAQRCTPLIRHRGTRGWGSSVQPRVLNMSGVFISHASSDKPLVDEFVDVVVRLGCGARSNQLFY